MADTSYRGVFTLEELLSLGQTGDVAKDWLAGGADRAVLKKKFPAGYYRISPTQALYVDPRSGSVPKQFIDMLDKATGDLPRDPISGAPSAYLPDNHVWQEPTYYKEAREALDRQKQLEAQGLTAQQAQDARLAQKPKRPADTYLPGLHNTAGSSAGAYARFIAQGGTAEMLKLPSFEGYEASRVATLKDALAENFMQRSGAQEGLQQMRAAQGLDPTTGTSTQEMQRLKDTYEALDPARRAQWLFYQDPANLTPELRELRQEARRGEKDLISRAQAGYAPERRYQQQNGQGRSYEFVIKKGDVSQTDTLGREKFFGNVPLKAELVKGKYNRLADVARRFGGGAIGGTLGFIGGGLAGGLLGAYQGAGGPMPQVKGAAGGVLGAGLGYVMGGGWGAAIGGYGGAGGVKGLKKGGAGDFSGFGTWRGSGAQIPGAKDLGQAVLFARMRKTGPKSQVP